ncbi:MAG: hypothetical protein WCI72_02795 [archaeon]
MTGIDDFMDRMHEQAGEDSCADHLKWEGRRQEMGELNSGRKSYFERAMDKMYPNRSSLREEGGVSPIFKMPFSAQLYRELFPSSDSPESASEAEYVPEEKFDFEKFASTPKHVPDRELDDEDIARMLKGSSGLEIKPITDEAKRNAYKWIDEQKRSPFYRPSIDDDED